MCIGGSDCTSVLLLFSSVVENILSCLVLTGLEVQTDQHKVAPSISFFFFFSYYHNFDFIISPKDLLKRAGPLKESMCDVCFGTNRFELYRAK